MLGEGGAWRPTDLLLLLLRDPLGRMLLHGGAGSSLHLGGGPCRAG